MAALPNLRRGGLSDDAQAALSASFSRPPSAATRVAEALRQQIVDGALPPGSQLVEESLATTLGVSRNTVREAYALLVGERIVERVPHRGVFVARPGSAVVRDLYLTRTLIEAAAVRWGPELTPRALIGLRGAVTAGQAARAQHDWVGVAQANQGFHRQVVDLSGSLRLTEAFSATLAEMRLVFHQTGDGAFHGPYVDDNDTVTTLLERGERDAAAEHTVVYLARARDDVLARLAAVTA